MKVATYNVNSIRLRVPIVQEWLVEYEPDVLVVQETKCEDAKFPIDDFEEVGYHCTIHGQKGFNGVAILSRTSLQKVSTGLGDPLFPEDCRVLMGEIDGVTIINTYVPNGTQVGGDKWDYKLRWLERFRKMIAERFRPTDPVIWMGDINIAPKPEDVYDSKKVYGKVGHHPDEFSRLQSIMEWGWTDCFRKFTQGPGHYSYFDYVITTSVERNQGWRIDHIYASDGLAPLCTACAIDLEPRKVEKPSDHTVVWAEFDR